MKQHSAKRWPLAGALSLGVVMVAAQAAETGAPIGAATLVNTDTEGTKRYVDVATARDGSGVTVWEQPGDTSSQIRARLFGSGGALADTEIAIGSGNTPSVATDADGRFVVVWRNTLNVLAQRYDADGTPIGSFVSVVYEGAVGVSLDIPDVALAADGSFVVSWLRTSTPGGTPTYQSYVRRYGADNQPLSAAVAVSTTGQQYMTRVASAADGRFVVTWAEQNGDGTPDTGNVYARLFDASATPGLRLRVPTVLDNTQVSPAIAMRPSGEFVIVWRSYVDNASGFAVLARRYDADGNRLGEAFEVSTPATRNIFANYEFYPAIGMADDGGFAVSWRSTASPLYLRPFDADGNPLADPVESARDGTYASVALDAQADAALVSIPFGDDENIELRRHTGTAPIDLAVGLSDTPDPAAPGTPVQYSVYVRNLTSGVEADPARGLAHDIGARLDLGGAAFISAAGAGWTCGGTTTIDCRYADVLPAGATAALLTVAAQGAPGTASVTATASVEDAHVEANTADNTATETTTVASGSGGPGPDTTPDGFSFIDTANVARASVVASNAVTITGINQAAPLRVSGGEYQIGDGAWTSADGSVSNGQTLRLRHTSSADFSAEALTRVEVGGIAAVFRSVTVARQTTPQAFSFATQSGVEPATVYVSNPVAIGGINDAAPISVSGGEYAVNGGGFTTEPGSVNAGDSVEVRTTSGPFGESRSATLVVGGTSANFTVITRAAPAESDAPPLVVENSGGAVGGSSLLGLLALALWRLRRSRA